MNDPEFEQRLRNAAASLRLSITEQAQGQLLHYLHLLGRWNETYNLTAIRKPSDQLVQHLFDSLAAVPSMNKLLCGRSGTRIRPGELITDAVNDGAADNAVDPTDADDAANAATAGNAGNAGNAVNAGNPLSTINNPPQDRPIRQQGEQHIWDVGSGAGLPGLIFAILWPHRKIHTVDSVGKKIAFQHQAIADLGLRNVTARQGRIELQVPTTEPNLIVCRAFASLSQFAAACETLAGPNTTLVAMKGKLPENELAELPQHWRIAEIERIKVPELDAERHLIMLNRN